MSDDTEALEQMLDRSSARAALAAHRCAGPFDVPGRILKQCVRMSPSLTHAPVHCRGVSVPVGVRVQHRRPAEARPRSRADRRCVPTS